MVLIRDRRGQMSVEAAVLLPVALVLVALLVQPACLLYTRSVMAAAAGELLRLAATDGAAGGEEAARSYALRRLAAVPDLTVFHEGGPNAWRVEVSGPDEAGAVSASIEGRVRPLPILGAIASAMGERDDGCVVVRVEVGANVRARWVDGSYEEWISAWG